MRRTTRVFLDQRPVLTEAGRTTVRKMLELGEQADPVNVSLLVEMPVTGLGDSGSPRPLTKSLVKLLSVVRPSINQQRVLVNVLVSGEQVAVWVPNSWTVVLYEYTS